MLPNPLLACFFVNYKYLIDYSQFRVYADASEFNIVNIKWLNLNRKPGKLRQKF